MQAQGFLADGEITDSRFYIWDLLGVNDADLRIQPYEIRYVHMTQHSRGVSDVLRVCETAMTTKAKRDFVKKMPSANAEGFVCKNRCAPRAGGRAGQHFKCKFVVTASFIVGPSPRRGRMTDTAPSPCISWTTIGSDSWVRWECPTAIGYRRKGRFIEQERLDGAEC